MRNSEIQKYLAAYKCGYCNNEFKQIIGKCKDVSSQVRCPECGTFLKTWDDVRSMEEK